MAAISNGRSMAKYSLSEKRKLTNPTKLLIPPKEVQKVLRGVCAATNAQEGDTKIIAEFISWLQPPIAGAEVDDCDDERAFTFRQWYNAAAMSPIFEDTISGILFTVTIGLALIRQKHRKGVTVDPTDLALVWGLVHHALTTESPGRSFFQPSRSPHGLVSVPLCSIVDDDGKIEELFRLDVWLPDGQRGNPLFSIHSHQLFGHAWVLAGQGVNQIYDVKSTTSPDAATHAEFRLSSNDSTTHETNQSSSIVTKTDKLASVTLNEAESRLYMRDMSYTIPEATFHCNVVTAHQLHASLFFFDSSRGFTEDAVVMGPQDAELCVQERGPANVTAAVLAAEVEATRQWEAGMRMNVLYFFMILIPYILSCILN